MTELTKPHNDLPLEDSIPEAGAPLESILCTEELRRRPGRPPDYEKKNHALVPLALPWATPNVPHGAVFSFTLPMSKGN